MGRAERAAEPNGPSRLDGQSLGINRKEKLCFSSLYYGESRIFLAHQLQIWNTKLLNSQ